MSEFSNHLTIKDIAKLSGVSKSTVSRVINHDPMVKETTRNKVMAIIEQYQFTPSKSARAMRGYGNKVIGIVVTRLDSMSENQAVRAMLPILYQYGYDPIIIESQFSVDKVEEHLTMLKEKQADGVIIFAFTGLEPSLLSFWENKSVIMARSYTDFTCVCYDDIGAVTTLLKYLHQSKHHKKIGFIGIEQHDQTTGALRYQAYMDYCQQNQISPNAYLGNLSYRSGYELAQSILSLSPTAIVCATDAIALGLNKYLQQNQLEHIVVASIGNSELLNFLFPNTLTVELGFDKAGTYAAKELLSMLQNTTLAKNITVPSTLIFNE
ncbi:trehalose operon repressor TreR [Gilliamella apicola]|uniref:trehalose operon repressor TreR n=1 Tax=Gilliamella apicola TaxID=1196095 RepID=UPI000D783985|nr:trehalose operon repressor TreR [Gilliamella apicola]PXY98133.1 trehalose operon repressor [Gilliamella apicola]WLS91940.1 trehalose operon repressor TreR [Gilliamella apicola]